MFYLKNAIMPIYLRKVFKETIEEMGGSLEISGTVHWTAENTWL